MFTTLWKKLFILCLLILLLVVYLLSLQIPFSEMGNKIANRYYLYKARHTLQCNDHTPRWLEVVVETAMDSSIFAGQIAFIDNDGHLYHCEYGYQDGRDGDKLVTVDTRFKYASISKIATAEAVLSMVRQHQLELDEYLVEVLGFDKTKLKDHRITEITIRDLLAHTAGFDRNKSGDPMFMIRKNVWCPKELDKIYDLQLDYAPSTERHYSNLGYCLLGAVLSKKTGQEFSLYMNEHFGLDALNMQYAVNDMPFEDEVEYYFSENDLSEYMRVFDFDGIQSSAGLTGSASSLAKMARFGIHQSMPNILTTDERLPCIVDEYQECYGLGSFKYQPPNVDDSFYIRNGSLPGFTGTLIMKPNVGVVVFLGNTRSVNSEKEIVQAIERQIMQGLSIQKDKLEK